MIISSLEGDDAITTALNSAMSATITRLVKDKVLTPEQANQFLDEHVCILANPKGGLAGWVARVFGKDATKTSIHCVHIHKDRP